MSVTDALLLTIESVVFIVATFIEGTQLVVGDHSYRQNGLLDGSHI